MKIEFKKKLPIAIIVASIFTVVFATVTVCNRSNWIPCILTQVSLSILMMLIGVNYFFYQNQKAVGCFAWAVSIFQILVINEVIFNYVRWY